MKLLCLTLLMIFAAMAAVAQMPSDTDSIGREKSPTLKFLNKRGFVFADTVRKNIRVDSLKKWPDTLYYNTVYRAKLLGSPTIPISFSKIERVNGKYEVSPTISIG